MGCSKVHFKDSMPKKVKTSILIDSSLIGDYYFVDSVLEKDDNRVYNSLIVKDFYKVADSTEYFNVIATISSRLICYKITLGKSYCLDKVDTSMIKLEADLNQKMTLDNYVYSFGSTTDTIINLNANDKFIYWNNKYYLNKMINKSDWEIYQLECIDKDLLSLNLTNNNDALALGLVKSNWEPIGSYTISLSNHQFIKFVDLGGFRTRYKIKKYAR